VRKSLTIYFIKPVGMAGPVKIGRSCSPDKRLETLRTWSPFPLEIVAQIDGPPELERRFHQHFIDLYESHEWFRVSNELEAVIREINEGTFNIDALPAPKKLPVKERSRAYLTPAWRYQRSVNHRLDHLRWKGVKEAGKLSIYLTNYLGRSPDRWPLHKQEIEQQIELLARQV
jgi:hypothetical protein